MTDSPNPMAGYPVLPIDPGKLLQYLKACQDAGVTYGLGAKDQTPKESLPIDFDEIDCSGFFRCAIYYATDNKILPPDGSVNQDDWCQLKKFKRSTFENSGLKDGRIRVCFKRSQGHGDIGHVWITLNGRTIESHGGKGPDSRDWDTPTLRKICTDVYVLADHP